MPVAPVGFPTPPEPGTERHDAAGERLSEALVPVRLRLAEQANDEAASRPA